MPIFKNHFPQWKIRSLTLKQKEQRISTLPPNIKSLRKVNIIFSLLHMVTKLLKPDVCIRYFYTIYAAKFSQCRRVSVMTGFVIVIVVNFKKETFRFTKHVSTFLCHLQFTINLQFTCTSANAIYCIACILCKKLYIGETCRRLDDRFREHLRDVEKDDKNASKPVARQK